MKLDGSDVRFVFDDAREIQRPFAIAVFEDSLYWTDWSSNSIKSVHKWKGHNPRTLNIGAYSVMDIKVYHEKRQNNCKYSLNNCFDTACQMIIYKYTCVCLKEIDTKVNLNYVFKNHLSLSVAKLHKHTQSLSTKRFYLSLFS